MKSSELSNVENRIALRQLLQHRMTGNYVIYDVIYDVIVWVQDGQNRSREF